jgi:hypothetical protein
VTDRSHFLDLSHAIGDGMPVFPGLPTPRIGVHLTHDASRDGSRMPRSKPRQPASHLSTGAGCENTKVAGGVAQLVRAPDS